jgi:hypothetical protein
MLADEDMLAAVDFAGRGGQREYPVRHVFQLVHVGQAADDESELVAAKPRHRVPAAHHLAQALGDDDEQLVTRGMAEVIVDLLEAVQVHEDHRQQLVVAFGQAAGLLQPFGQQLAVGQFREGVEMGQPFQLFLGAAELAEIGKDPDMARHPGPSRLLPP